MLIELLGILASAVCLWFVFRYRDHSRHDRVSAFAVLVGGFRGDGWPVGVQEEDRDRPWGRGEPAPTAPPDTPAPSPQAGHDGVVFEEVTAPIPAQAVRAAVRASR